MLVSHNVELVLPGAEYFVRLLDGRIDAQGVPEDLRQQGLLDTLSKASHAEELKLDDAKQDDTTKPAAAEENRRPRQLVKDEARETGGVKWSIYKTYLKASGYHTWIILLIGITSYQVFGLAEKLWIKQWGEAYDDAPVGAATISSMHYFNPMGGIGDGEWESYLLVPPAVHLFNAFRNTTSFTTPSSTVLHTTAAINLPSATSHPFFYVGIYAALSFGATFVYISNVIVQYNGALRGSRVLFKQLLVAVVRATMRWHDSTPTGLCTLFMCNFKKDLRFSLFMIYFRTYA